MYKLDPTRHDLASEFKKNPYGQHSPDLQYLLNLMRTPSAEPFHVLVTKVPGACWELGLLEPGSRNAPHLTGVVFTSTEDAEWFVFKARWKNISGQDCPIE